MLSFREVCVYARFQETQTSGANQNEPPKIDLNSDQSKRTMRVISSLLNLYKRAKTSESTCFSSSRMPHAPFRDTTSAFLAWACSSRLARGRCTGGSKRGRKLVHGSFSLQFSLKNIDIKDIRGLYKEKITDARAMVDAEKEDCV